MTLLTKGVRYYLRCSFGHRFERAKPDSLRYCPKCGGVVKLYGLADSTTYAEDSSTGLPPQEDVAGS